MDFEDYLHDSYIMIMESLKYYKEDKSHIVNFIYMRLHKQWFEYRKSMKYKQQLFENDMLTRKLNIDNATSDEYILEDSIEDDDTSVVELINIMEKLDKLEKVLPMLKNLTMQYYLFGVPQNKLAELTGSSKQSVNAKIQRNINNIRKYIDQMN
jgi:DNA-directed RNA polymerase specialized sigma24 family protein